MRRREISEQLKQDIYRLEDIARKYAPREIQDEISTTIECIYAGLTDYELAWRGYYGEEEE